MFVPSRHTMTYVCDIVCVCVCLCVRHAALRLPLKSQTHSVTDSVAGTPTDPAKSSTQDMVITLCGSRRGLLNTHAASKSVGSSQVAPAMQTSTRPAAPSARVMSPAGAGQARSNRVPRSERSEPSVTCMSAYLAMDQLQTEEASSLHMGLLIARHWVQGCYSCVLCA